MFSKFKYFMVILSLFTSTHIFASSKIPIRTIVTEEGTFRYVENELLVGFKDNVDDAKVQRIASSYSGQISNLNKISSKGHALIKFDESTDLDQIKSALQSDENIEYVNYNYVGSFCELIAADKYYPDQWSLRTIKASQAWTSYTYGDSSVVVAILDSGYSSHSDMPGYSSRVLQGPQYNMTIISVEGDVAEPYADYKNHAMGIAGIIGAFSGTENGMTGTTWFPRLWFIKVGISDELGGLVTADWLKRGILTVTEAAIANPDKRYIINASINIPVPDSVELACLENAIAYADDNNVLIVAAAGNTSFGDKYKPEAYRIYYPAIFSRLDQETHYSNVICVGAVDSLCYPTDYTNYLGPDTCEVYVDLAAPGGLFCPNHPDECDTFCPGYEIITLSTKCDTCIYPETICFNVGDCDTCYQTIYGTSASTALVSGAAALLWSLDPFLTHHEIKNILKSSTYDPNDPTGWDYDSYPTWCDDVIPVEEEHPMLGYYFTEEGCLGYEYNRKKGTGILNIYEALRLVKEPTLHGTVDYDLALSGDIYVKGDVTITSGNTLTLNPGCRLMILRQDEERSGEDTVRVEIDIEGTLEIIGTSMNPVQIIPAGGTLETEHWTGIRIYGSNAGADISNCYISKAYHGIKSTEKITVDKTTIADCEVHGLFLMGSGATGSRISNSTFCDNGSAGIMSSFCDSVAIDTCDINNNYYGIYYSSSEIAKAKKCELIDNSCDGIRVSNSDPCDIEWCFIENNGQNGVYYSQSSGEIQNSKIWRNDINGVLCSGSQSDPIIGHSKIEQNFVGIKSINGACPILGQYWMGGDNSIYNQQWYVYGSTSYTIMAENNWWGTGPGETPNPAKFRGLVDHTPWLTSDPVIYLMPQRQSMAKVFSMRQNYPNPVGVAGTTAIRYDIPDDNEKVSLKIYDVAGRRIKTLVDKNHSAGSFTVLWDGRNDHGSRVASGIYFCRLTMGKEIVTKKIVLL
ncbi:MAG: S8 family serine peptidase, partial [Candidatus Krumholzibacteria bacterium]|nr:S8 family serine peptidase [Candidatus Krumholzibacteria bacterium]